MPGCHSKFRGPWPKALLYRSRGGQFRIGRIYRGLTLAFRVKVGRSGIAVIAQMAAPQRQCVPVGLSPSTL
jgi:hypothetical protein